MSTEQQLEQEIQAKGLNAPRLKPEDIDAVIVYETYTVLPSRKVMVCELTLKNGFTVRGEAATVSPENFDVEIGKKISRENARNKVWELEGYLLQECVYQETIENAFAGQIATGPEQKLFYIRSRNATEADVEKNEFLKLGDVCMEVLSTTQEDYKKDVAGLKFVRMSTGNTTAFPVFDSYSLVVRFQA